MTAFLEASIQVLIAERDEYQKAAVRTAVNCKAEYDKLLAERDALRVAAEAYKVVRDTLTARLNQLETAAKLGLEALDDWHYGANQDRPKAAVYVALRALKQAGVA